MLNASNHQTVCRPPRARTVAATAMAILCATAQLLSFVHLALVRHATCPEHDEVVHASARSPAAAPAAAEHTARTSRIHAAPAESATHADDHCLVIAGRRRELAPLAPEPRGLPTVAPPDHAAGHLPAEAPARPVPLLSLAPKSSPPTAIG